MKSKRFDKNKALYVGVIVFLCLVFVVGFCYGLDTVLKMEGSYPPVENEEGLTPAPITDEEALNHLTNVLNKASLEKPYLEKKVRFDIDNDSIVCGGQSFIKSCFTYLSENIEDTLNSNFEDYTADFGKGFSEKITLPSITSDNIDCSLCDYIYYECPSCGETDAESHASCEKCGGGNPYNLKYSDEYKNTIYCKPSALDLCFNPVAPEELAKMLGEEYKEFFTINSLNVTYDNLLISFNILRLSDKITSLEYKKEMTVSLGITFTGDYEALGAVDLNFAMTQSEKYSFTWPGLELNTHYLAIEPKATDNLLATLTCDNPLNYDVTWEISDESVATIDSEGYIKGSKAGGFCTATASYEFQGKTYKDECEIFIGYSVESNSLNIRKLTLNGAGANAALVATVSPSNATVKTVKWYSRDESVATVNENGEVTAVSAGQTQIYALSDDGYFRSTCEVTVNE